MKQICTLIIPIYNELQSLKDLLGEIESISSNDLGFLFVDNGSNEEMLNFYTNLSPLSRVRFLRLNNNVGFGGAISAGILDSRSDFVGWMPGNLKVSAGDAQRMWESLTAPNFEFAKARRIRSSFLANTKTYLAGMFHSVNFGVNMADSGGTPPYAKRESMLAFLQDAPSGYEFEAYVLFKFRLKKVSILRPRVKYGVRKYGKSHWQNGLSAELKLLSSIGMSKRKWSRQ